MHKQVVKLPLCSTDCVGLNTGVRVVARFVAGAVRVCVCCVSLYRTAFFLILSSQKDMTKVAPPILATRRARQ